MPKMGTAPRLRIPAFIAGAAFAFALTPANAAELPKKDHLSVTFVVTGTLLYNGKDPAKLKMLKGGGIGGEIGLYNSLGLGPFKCKVTDGSTLKNKRLRLQCDSQGLTDVFTFTGSLNPLTGKGKGSFSESLTGSTGYYIVAPTN